MIEFSSTRKRTHSTLPGPFRAAAGETIGAKPLLTYFVELRGIRGLFVKATHRVICAYGDAIAIERTSGLQLNMSLYGDNLIRTFRGQRRLSSLDALRGLASFAVMWFHFTYDNYTFLESGPVKSSGTYGWLGVEVFFVISGFVIPHSLWRSDYRLTDFGRFVCKRVARLDPPYLAAIIVILALGWLPTQMSTHGVKPFAVPWTQVALHLGYLNVFFVDDYPWLNPAFWTLAIEFQFYVCMGLLYPLLTSSRHRLIPVVAASACLALSVILPSPVFLPHYAPLFFIGTVLFQYRAGMITAQSASLALVGLELTAAVLLGPAIAVVGLLTPIAIVLLNTSHGGLSRVLGFLGGISYSLYLLHQPIGGRIIDLGMRYAHSSSARWVVLVAAVVGSITASWAFAMLIEWPAQRLASRLPLRRRWNPAEDGDIICDYAVAGVNGTFVPPVEVGASIQRTAREVAPKERSSTP